MNQFSAPISEENYSADEGEIGMDEQEQKSTISNINSMDPVQWSNVKRDIVEQNKHQYEIRKKLMYS